MGSIFSFSYKIEPFPSLWNNDVFFSFSVWDIVAFCGPDLSGTDNIVQDGSGLMMILPQLLSSVKTTSCLNTCWLLCIFFENITSSPLPLPVFNQASRLCRLSPSLHSIIFGGGVGWVLFVVVLGFFVGEGWFLGFCLFVCLFVFWFAVVLPICRGFWNLWFGYEV